MQNLKFHHDPMRDSSVNANLRISLSVKLYRKNSDVLFIIDFFADKHEIRRAVDRYASTNKRCCVTLTFDPMTLKTCTAIPLTWRIFVASFSEIPPLSKEISYHAQ